MKNNLIKYCQSLLDFSESEISIIKDYFITTTIGKKDYLLQENKVCDFVAFIEEGSIRHFHIKDGNEITCDISLENNFITEFKSFNNGSKSYISFQTLEDTKVQIIKKNKLLELYKLYPKYEILGRKIAEKVAMRNTAIALSLASSKPETRYKELLNKNPEIFQRVPQKYIANFLGIKPESLSRIRKRILFN
ncbi:Crp/Fnr family transcriptional regulator [Psychroflexus sp. MES1-P1E]|uniref:Crp/Fnr family transcriptional regulator n=1 Tax=Psychroflexus sp. MES1-P1E TaxID=2058320 RepID=UPI000C7BF9CC|nr:Crp/Fnr family transcriptional regulator [Psychroflexus sp. MES1-P1E]PKG42869.1 Crp/Fnr family transcriptional regulator [Psychroflexus sp. MES1-P1E]